MRALAEGVQTSPVFVAHACTYRTNDKASLRQADAGKNIPDAI